MLKEIIGRLANALSTEDMRHLNYEVDANKRRPADVVREWLTSKSF
jgi:glycine betaine/choline ABC-type transport system substrate-binding protein